MKRKFLYKIGATLGISGMIVGTVLGIHYGLNQRPRKSQKSATYTLIKDFFDTDIITSNSTYLSENIITPLKGHSLISYVTPIDQSHFANEKVALPRLILQNNNQLSILKEYNIDVEKLFSIENLNDELKKLIKIFMNILHLHT